MAFMIARMTALNWLFGTRSRVPVAQAWPLFMKAMMEGRRDCLFENGVVEQDAGRLAPEFPA